MASPRPFPDIMNTLGDTLETSNRDVTGLGVFVQDQTTFPLTVPFLIQRSTATLSANAVVNSRTVELVAGHSAQVGEILELADPSMPTVFMQSRILNVATNTITLDKPINYPYEAATTQVVVSSDDMQVDGSVTPQVFSVLPLPAQSGDMVRVIWRIESSSAMDFETFGGATGLTNGCVLRINNGDGTYRNLFNWKTNGDIINEAYDYSFQQNTANNARGFTSRLTWGGQSKHGVVIRLDGSKGEALEVVVQDDLTSGNTRFTMKAQGHEIQG